MKEFNIENLWKELIEFTKDKKFKFTKEEDERSPYCNLEKEGDISKRINIFKCYNGKISAYIEFIGYEGSRVTPYLFKESSSHRVEYLYKAIEKAFEEQHDNIQNTLISMQNTWNFHKSSIEKNKYLEGLPLKIEGNKIHGCFNDYQASVNGSVDYSSLEFKISADKKDIAKILRLLIQAGLLIPTK